MAKAKTFLNDETIEVEIISVAPSSTGLLVVQHPKYGKLARHVTRLDPIDEEGAAVLRKEWKK